MANYHFKMNLNLHNLRVDNAAVFTWSNPSAAAAHEGVTLNDGTQLPGYQWTDLTHQQVNLPQLFGSNLEQSTTINGAFQATAEQLGQAYQETLQQAPANTPFDYGAIADSQSLTYE